MGVGESSGEVSKCCENKTKKYDQFSDFSIKMVYKLQN